MECGAAGLASSDSSRALIHWSVPGKSRSPSAARTYRPEPPASTGTLPRAMMSSMAAWASSWYSATFAVAGHRPDVEQVVRDAVALGLGLLGGADIHALVELHRVGVDDLAAEHLGQRDGQAGLAGGGRAHHGDDVRAHGYKCARRQLATK